MVPVHSPGADLAEALTGLPQPCRNVLEAIDDAGEPLRSLDLRQPKRARPGVRRHLRGILGGVAVGVGALWLVSRTLRLGEVLGTTVQLDAVVAVAAGCDALREDSGLYAARATIGPSSDDLRREVVEVAEAVGLLLDSLG